MTWISRNTPDFGETVHLHIWPIRKISYQTPNKRCSRATNLPRPKMTLPPRSFLSHDMESYFRAAPLCMYEYSAVSENHNCHMWILVDHRHVRFAKDWPLGSRACASLPAILHTYFYEYATRQEVDLPCDISEPTSPPKRMWRKWSIKSPSEDWFADQRPTLWCPPSAQYNVCIGKDWNHPRDVFHRCRRNSHTSTREQTSRNSA